MAQVIVDDVLLREPNLLTPGKRPVGPVISDIVTGFWTAQGGYMSGFGPPMVQANIQNIIQTQWGQAIENSSSTSALTDANFTSKIYALILDFELTIGAITSTTLDDVVAGTVSGTGTNNLHAGVFTGYLTNETLGWQGGGSERSGTDTEISLGKHVVVMFYDPDGTHTYWFAMDGKMMNQLTPTTSSVTLIDASLFKLVGYRSSAKPRFRWLSAQIIGTQISRQQALSLTTDPYQFLIPA